MDPKIYKPSIYNGAGIYKAGAEGGGGGGGSGGILPEGYTLQDKLHFEGTESNYFEVIKSSNNSYKFEFTGKVNSFNENVAESYILKTSRLAPNIWIRNDDKKIYARNTRQIGFNWNTGLSRDILLNDFKMVINQGTFILNDTNTFSTYYENVTNDYFGFSDLGNSHKSPNFDIYYLKVYNGNNLFYYGLPAVDDNTGKDGLFDMVSNTFKASNH